MAEDMSAEPGPAIGGIAQWLLRKCLGEARLANLLPRLAQKLREAGYPVDRVNIACTTLHPLHRSSAVIWSVEEGIFTDRFGHADGTSDAQWAQSPMRFAILHGLDSLRLRLEGPDPVGDFPVLDELIARGYTDYVLVAHAYESFFRSPTRFDTGAVAAPNGMIVTWATRRPGGFTKEEIAGLFSLRPVLAVLTKIDNQREIASSLAECYIGREAGRRVLQGAIRRGDFVRTDAVVWLSDMRDSTELAAKLSREEFIAALNGFFDRTVGMVEEEGGEALTFIGDGALAIFPVERAGPAEARAAALRAVRRAEAAMSAFNAERRAAGLRPLGYGIGLHAGPVDYGNIGLAQRQAWSVIGPVVNETARIEGLTRELGVPVLASASFVAGAGAGWRRLGAFSLQGVKEPFEAFAPPPG
jgi:adenylate cyclase